MNVNAILEGSCISLLGLIDYDFNTNRATMTNLFAVVAGGYTEVKRRLKKDINLAFNLGMTFAACCLFCSILTFLPCKIFYEEHTKKTRER